MRWSMPGRSIVGADAGDDCYYLWSLERVALIYDLKKIGGKDWYAWASDALVKTQQKDGSWHDKYAGAPDTCFALLVLKRVNIVRDLKVDTETKETVKKIANIKG